MAIKHLLKRKRNEEDDAQVVPAKRISNESTLAKVCNLI